ncbi:MAG: hypothetical protein ACOCZQ_00990 [Nanoarchaeota archaeon]
MGFLGKILGKEEKKESPPDFSGEQNRRLHEGFDQSNWQMPEKPIFGEQGMDDNFQNYGNWQPSGMNQQHPPQMGHERGQFNENVQVREINTHPHMNTQPTQNWSDKSITKDLEIISSKLDAIKSSIENLDHRLKSLERIAEEKQKTPQYPYRSR